MESAGKPSENSACHSERSEESGSRVETDSVLVRGPDASPLAQHDKVPLAAGVSLKNVRVFVSANDPSADVHCAGVIHALKRRSREIEFVGIGGSKMADAGCKLLENPVGRAVMTYKAFTQVGYYYGLLRRIRRFLRDNRVDLVIVCDSPSFNFHVAKAAKRAGVRTLFYVAPQLWAWGAWRIGKLRRCCDKLCCLLPFEEPWFKQRGVDAAFVGNPLLDKLPPDLTSHRKDYARFDPSWVHIALMPGSRLAEIDSLWRPMQEISLRLRQKYPKAHFTAVAPTQERQTLLVERQIPGFTCDYSVDSVTETAKAADFSLVASGSATLEVASAGCPMVVMYQSSPILWHLAGRWLVKAKHLALVNLLADRELVPEFMPYFKSIEPIVNQVDAILQDANVLRRISGELVDLVETMTVKKAAEETARIVLGILEGVG
jgi:lipid-A-disaccharide synthase